MWRADRPASGAVTRSQSAGNIIRLPCACADPFQRADKAAHLIMQERPRTDMEPIFGTGVAGDNLDPQFVQRFYRAFGLTDRRPEGREIMMPHQMIRTGLHRVRIQHVIDPPHLPRL